MDPLYAGETDPKLEPFRGYSVERPSREQLDRFYSLRFGPGGTVYGRGNRPFETSSGDAPFGQGGRAIFVMDPHGRIFASNNVAPGEFHHSSLSGGQPVAAAGELAVRNGQIQYVTSASGHYRPQWVHMLNLKHELERQGINGVRIYDHEGPVNNNPPMFITGQP